MSIPIRQSTAFETAIGPVLDADGVAVTDCVIGDFKLKKTTGNFAALNGSATLTHVSAGVYDLVLTTSDTDTVGTCVIAIDDTVNACQSLYLQVMEEAVYDALYAASANAWSGAAGSSVVSAALRDGAHGGSSATLQLATSNFGAISGTTFTLSGAVAFQSTFAVTGNTTFTGTTTYTGHVLYSDGIAIAAPSTTNRDGLKITGNGVGYGFNILSGMLVTAASGGNALTLTPNGGNGSGLRTTGVGSGNGIYASNSTSSGAAIRASGFQGHGLQVDSSNGGNGLNAASTSAIGINVAGDTGGIVAAASSSGNGLSVAGAGSAAGFIATGGATGNGASFVGGSTSGDGINCSVTSGVELNADITGNITGNLSGSAGSVTGAVGSVTGNVGGNVAGSVGSVTGAVGSVTGAVGSVTGNVGGNVTGSVGSLATQAKADVNAEVLDVLNVDTFAEPGQGSPAATASIFTKISYLYKAWRNKKTKTATESALYNDAGDTVDQKTTDSDDGTTGTRGEQVTGP